MLTGYFQNFTRFSVHVQVRNIKFNLAFLVLRYQLCQIQWAVYQKAQCMDPGSG